MRRLLLDLDSEGGTDPFGMFRLFLNTTADVLAPCLGAVFRPLLRFNWVAFSLAGDWL